MSATDRPSLYIVAGPNGAGKTTFAREFLQEFGFCEHFLNADLIAEELAPCPPEAVIMRSGRKLLEEIEKLSQQRATFAFETTLSGRAYVPILGRLKKEGYRSHLFFLWLPSVEMALERVAVRVRRGGHHVADDIVKRRDERGLRNLTNVYRQLVDSWILFDNSGPTPRVVAHEEDRRLEIVDARAVEVIADLRNAEW